MPGRIREQQRMVDERLDSLMGIREDWLTAAAIVASSLSSSSLVASMPCGIHTSPSSTARMPCSSVAIDDDFGIKPLAPCWIERRITAGSSIADTMTVGNDSWLLRM